MENVASLLLGFSVQALPFTKMLPIVALITAITFYIIYRAAPDGTSRSFTRFSVGFLVVSIPAGLLGVGIGIKYFCAYTQSNLCGLGGFFFTGPVAFSLAAAVYLFLWVKRGKVP